MQKIFLAALISFPLAGFAQQGKQLRLSLQQALDTGLQNRYDIRAAGYNIALAENALGKSKKIWIPDVNASGNIRYNTQLQATYIPKGFIGLTEPDLLAFGAKNETVFGLDLTETIYKPGLHTDIKIAENELALQREKDKAAAIGVKDQSAASYFNVLLKTLQYRIDGEDESSYGQYFELSEGR